MHYWRWRQHGTTSDDAMVERDRRHPLDRIEVPDLNGCWIWSGGLKLNGYGYLRVGKKGHLAHRWVYEELVGPIPNGLTIDHLCRVKACVNPDHLEPVTNAENIRRAVEARRAS
jgi:hypothetical protein